jgi:hypothetical protein
MAQGNPFAPGPTSLPGPLPGPFANFGRYFGTGFQVYFQRWQDWLVPMLVLAVVALAAMCCCYFPFFLAAGPMVCGLYACGLETLRGRPINTGTLWRGWPAAWNSMSAWLAVNLLGMLPMVLVCVLPMVAWTAMASTLGGAAPRGQAPQPADALAIAVMFGSFALMMVGSVVAMAWAFWLSTRTMFVLPLIADRGLDFLAAWRSSWQSTRSGFWELVLLNFVAGFIAGLGAYACYVGLIFTLPIYYTIIAAAYEDRFGWHAATRQGPAS